MLCHCLHANMPACLGAGQRCMLHAGRLLSHANMPARLCVPLCKGAACQRSLHDSPVHEGRSAGREKKSRPVEARADVVEVLRCIVLLPVAQRGCHDGLALRQRQLLIQRNLPIRLLQTAGLRTMRGTMAWSDQLRRVSADSAYLGPHGLSRPAACCTHACQVAWAQRRILGMLLCFCASAC